MQGRPGRCHTQGAMAAQVLPAVMLSMITQTLPWLRSHHLGATSTFCHDSLVNHSFPMSSAQQKGTAHHERGDSEQLSACWGEAPREVTPTCYHHPANCCLYIINLVQKETPSSALHCHHLWLCRRAIKTWQTAPS